MRAFQRQRRRALVAGMAAVCLGCGAPMAPDVVAWAQPADSSRVRIVIPEVYELANVIIAMSAYGQSSPYAVFRSGEYYQRVSAAFSPLRGHSSMQALQLGTSDPQRRYYELRDNSFAYVFEQHELRRNPAYGTLRSPNLFRERRPAVQDFAVASGFREFFSANAAYYRNVIDRYRDLAEVDSMVDWLEVEFAPLRFRHYTVVLSPLVYGSHSANFDVLRDECIAFVSGPDVTTGPGTTAGVRKATIQRILFTEIDHAFVNPTTERYRTRVNTAFGTRARWTRDTSSFYTSPMAVFNEYMTWAVFLLYAEGRLDAQEFQEVRRNAVQTMEVRGFQQFGAFSAELLRLYRDRAPGARVLDLYPVIIDWAAVQ